jgi:fumarate reductase subunit C
MKELLEERVRKSRIPARLDLIQSLSGLALALFMWVHLILVSSILLGKDTMLAITRLMEGSFLRPDVPGGYPALVTGAALSVFVIFIVHAGLAMRKFPANWKQAREMRSHISMMKHKDTTQWWTQAVTGFVMFFLGSAHLIIMASNPDQIGPNLSADRFVTWGLWPMYLILLFAVEFHGAIGMYRLAVKWGVFDGKDPRKTRKRLKLAKNIITVFFLGLGIASFAAYIKIGIEQSDKPGERYVPAAEAHLEPPSH